MSSVVLRRRHRAYFGFATSTVALALGVNIVVFCVVNALWLRPLPFSNADRLVTILGTNYARLDGPLFEGFEAVAGQVTTDGSLMGLRPEIQMPPVAGNLETLAVTSGYFQLLGLAVRGRDFTAVDDGDGAEPVAIISDRLWSRAFERRPDVIGSVIPARPIALRVIGVAPRGFEGARRGEHADLWIPSRLVRHVAPMKVEWSQYFLTVFARLPPGHTAAQFEQRFRATIPQNSPQPDVIVAPLKDVFGAPESPGIAIREANALGVVGGLALLVLGGGCATLAALVLVHYERRRLELAMRLALGASRMRLVRDLFRELALIGACGTIGAILLAVLGLRALPSLSLPGGVNLARLDLSIDWRVLSVAIGATAMTLLAAASLPMVRFTRRGLAAALVAGPTSTASAGSQRLRQALLASLVCASIVVLVAAGLFVRAVIHGFGSAPGFDVHRTLFVTVRAVSAVPGPTAAVREDLAERTTRIRDALRTLPGVESVADGAPPIDPDATARLRRPTAIDTLAGRREFLLGRLNGSPELLATLGVPILAGRGLRPGDEAMNPVPTIVTASIAKEIWPTENPLGQILGASFRGGQLLIVGIAPDFVYGSLSRPATGVVATATSAFGFGIEPRFVVRAAEPDALVRPIHDAVRAAVPDVAWVRVSTGRDLISRDIGRQRLGAWFFSGFGLSALVLGVGGVFGLVAYLAESRRREFGVRLVLGATSRDLLRHGLVAALVPVSIGVAAGLACGASIALLFESLLVGLSARDPLTYAAVALMMLSSATTAALGAGWRLQRLTPADALRMN